MTQWAPVCITISGLEGGAGGGESRLRSAQLDEWCTGRENFGEGKITGKSAMVHKNDNTETGAMLMHASSWRVYFE